MKYQPNRDYKSDDSVMTPPHLAKSLVDHFKPKGKGLEPCCGTGNILQYLNNADWCEITKGEDFFDYHEKVDYIFTNPPWSQIRPFLIHAMELADDIYFLFTINHLWTKARLRDIENHNFGIVEICIFDTPKEFPQSGFQCGMVHLKKNYKGGILFTRLKELAGEDDVD
jgi:hypothetical protein